MKSLSEIKLRNDKYNFVIELSCV